MVGTTTVTRLKVTARRARSGVRQRGRGAPHSRTTRHSHRRGSGHTSPMRSSLVMLLVVACSNRRGRPLNRSETRKSSSVNTTMRSSRSVAATTPAALVALPVERSSVWMASCPPSDVTHDSYPATHGHDRFRQPAEDLLRRHANDHGLPPDAPAHGRSARVDRLPGHTVVVRPRWPNGDSYARGTDWTTTS